MQQSDNSSWTWSNRKIVAGTNTHNSPVILEVAKVHPAIIFQN